MFISVVAIAAIGIAYIRPSQSPPDVLSLPATYQLEGVDFVNATPVGLWPKFDSGRFALLHTGDAGRTWTHQLAGDAISAASTCAFSIRATASSRSWATSR